MIIGKVMKRALSARQKEERAIEISPEADAAMDQLKELFAGPRCWCHRPTFAVTPKALLRKRSWTRLFSVKKTANIDDGSDTFMGSDLFPEFRVSGKRLKPRRENHLLDIHREKR